MRYIKEQRDKLRSRNAVRVHTTSKENGSISNPETIQFTEDEGKDHQETLEDKVPDREMLAWNCEVANYI